MTCSPPDRDLVWTPSLILQPFLRPVGGCFPGVGGTQMRGSSCFAGRGDGWLPFGLEAPLTNLLSRCPSVSSGQLCASLSSPDTYIWARPLYSQSQTQPPHTICYFFVCESKTMPQYDQMCVCVCVCVSVTFSAKHVFLLVSLLCKYSILYRGFF